MNIKYPGIIFITIPIHSMPLSRAIFPPGLGSSSSLCNQMSVYKLRQSFENSQIRGIIFVQEYIWRVKNPLQKQLHSINLLDSESSLPTISMQRSSVSLDTSLPMNRSWNYTTQFLLLLSHSQEGLSVPPRIVLAYSPIPFGFILGLLSKEAGLTGSPILWAG